MIGIVGLIDLSLIIYFKLEGGNKECLFIY